MKKNYYSRPAIALAGVLLALSGAVCSADLWLNSFDNTNEVSAFTMGGAAGAFSWDSSQNSPTAAQAPGSGSMYVTCLYNSSSFAPSWAWQEAQFSRTSPGLDLSTYESAAWDIKVDQANSYTDWSAAGYSYAAVIFQNYAANLWGNGVPAGYVTTNVGWQHFSGKIPPGYGAMDAFIIDFNGGGWDHSPSNTISYWADAYHLISPVGPPPRLSFAGRAIPGLNFWTITPDGTRHGIYTAANYSWIGNSPASFSFTITDFPTNAADSGYSFAMLLVGGAVANNASAADWNNPSVIFTQIQCDTNGVATWTFRWKTNSAGSNGDYYDYPLPFVTNPTPIGTWTLSFDASDIGVTMTAPNGDSTNFTLGVTPNISDLELNTDFENGAWISLNVNGYTGTNNYCKRAVISRFSISENYGYSGFTNDFTKSVVDTNIWFVDAGDARFSLFDVPTTNAYYIKWGLPDNGFALQTNNVAYNKLATNYTVIYDANTNPIGTNVNVGGWSTNGVPQAFIPAPRDLSHTGIIIDTNRYTLIKPSTFPAQYGKDKLLFRLSQPGF
jgi:hypothetical protein